LNYCKVKQVLVLCKALKTLALKEELNIKNIKKKILKGLKCRKNIPVRVICFYVKLTGIKYCRPKGGTILKKFLLNLPVICKKLKKQ